MTRAYVWNVLPVHAYGDEQAKSADGQANASGGRSSGTFFSRYAIAPGLSLITLTLISKAIICTATLRCSLFKCKSVSHLHHPGRKIDTIVLGIPSTIVTIILAAKYERHRKARRPSQPRGERRNYIRARLHELGLLERRSLPNS
jgi:hypothetical protein